MDIELNQKNKQLVWNFWQHLEAASADQMVQIANDSLVSNISWHGPDPINELHGVQSFVTDFWLPLQKSFHDLKRQTHIFIGGKSNGRIDGKDDAAAVIEVISQIVEIAGLDIGFQPEMVEQLNGTVSGHSRVSGGGCGRQRRNISMRNERALRCVKNYGQLTKHDE